MDTCNFRIYLKSCKQSIQNLKQVKKFRINFNNIKSVSLKSNNKMYSLCFYSLSQPPALLSSFNFESMCILKCIFNFMSIIWHNQLSSNYVLLFISMATSNCTPGDKIYLQLLSYTHTLLLIQLWSCKNSKLSC